MPEYIERETAIAEMLTRYWDGKETLREIMNSIPAADVRPALYDGAKTIGDLCDRLDAIVPELADKFWAALEQRSIKEKKTQAGLWLVKSAKWSRIDYQRRGHDYVCSSCGWKNDMATRFCPGCGADMREES